MSERDGGRALLVYDGACAFCLWAVGVLKTATGERVVCAPSQEIAQAFPDIPRERFRRSVQLMDDDGRRYEGAQAVLRAFAHAPGQSWLRRLYEAPLVAPVLEAAYRLIARHRGIAFRIATLLWGARPERPRHGHAAGLFLRALPVAYLTAFLSWLPQLPGLVGPDGLLPAGPPAAFWQGLALLGSVASFVALAGRWRGPALLVAWLSCAVISFGAGEFLVRGDALLLEAGFLALFLVPWRGAASVSASVVWLYRFLLFRAFFADGLARLLQAAAPAQDPLSLARRFETQPLPTPLAWHANALPDGVLRATGTLAAVLELIVPFLFLMPRRARLVGAGFAAVLAIMRIALGNEAAFGWLLLAMVPFLLDDAALERLVPKLKRAPSVPASPPRRWRPWFAGASVALGSAVLLSSALPERGLLRSFAALAVQARVVGDYAAPVLPPSREELVLEGSDDGLEWKEYAFRHLPGDVKRAPAFVAPFQPRLEGRLREAAAAPDASGAWIRRIADRLLEGSEPVAALFRTEPFPDAPPRFVRATVYRYRFTTPHERALDGAWWRRSMRAEELPPTSLQGRQQMR